MSELKASMLILIKVMLQKISINVSLTKLAMKVKITPGLI